ncbi:hypothetical protein Tco_1392431 [Tanacetum coccineum]
MEAHLAPKSYVQVNKIASSCKICTGPHGTQYCMENLEQAFVDYASSRTNEAGGKWFTFKPEQNNLGDTYNPSWKSHPNLRWRQPQNSQNNFSNPPNHFWPNDSFLNRSFNNNPQNFNNLSNLEGLVSNFMASQDARLSKFEADFKQQQGEMTNKIDTVLKAINDRMTRALPSDTVKNPKLNDNSTSLIFSAHSYPARDPQCLSQIHGSINAIIILSKQPNKSHNDQLQGHDTTVDECKMSKEEGKEEKGDPENINTNPPSPPDLSISFMTENIYNDGDVMFIEIIKKYDDSFKEELGEDEVTVTRGLGVERMSVNDFCCNEVKPILNYLHSVFKILQKQFPEEVKTMIDVFESMESDLDATWKQNVILNNQLLEATLKHDIGKCVLMCNDSMNDDLTTEIEKFKRKSIDVQENLHKRTKILEYCVQRCQKQSLDFELQLQHQKEKTYCEYSLKNLCETSWISKIEKFQNENVSL